jgi:hypothetical protein
MCASRTALPEVLLTESTGLCGEGENNNEEFDSYWGDDVDAVRSRLGTSRSL